MKTVDADEILARATPLRAHDIVLTEARTMARLAANNGDDGSNDLIVSDVIRRNELQAWFVAEHVVNAPLTHASS